MRTRRTPLPTALLSAAIVMACGRAPPTGASPSAGAATARDASCHHGSHDRPLAPATAPSEMSLYQLPGRWTDQDGRAFALASARGSPCLVVMFYGSCRTVCPALVEDARRVERALSPAARQRLRVVLVSFDGANDTPERLRALAREKGLDLSRWTLVRGDDADVRALAVALGVQYTRMPDGSFNHSGLLTLLDAEGVGVHRVEGVGRPIDEMARRVEAMAP